MIDLASAAVTETPPGPDRTDRPAAWDLVIGLVLNQRERFQDIGDLGCYDALLAAMYARDRLGESKYGRRLRAFNGQDAIAEAFQESLDLCAYLANNHLEQQSLISVELLNQAIHLSFRLARELRKPRG